MYKFISEDSETKTKITMEFETINLEVMLSRFEEFLLGCGYVFEGTVGILKDEVFQSDLNDTNNEVDLILGKYDAN